MSAVTAGFQAVEVDDDEVVDEEDESDEEGSVEESSEARLDLDPTTVQRKRKTAAAWGWTGTDGVISSGLNPAEFLLVSLGFPSFFWS